MTTQTEKAARFLELHRPGNPLLLPNPWDQGSARLLASLGFQALATTSSGFAVTLGRSMPVNACTIERRSGAPPDPRRKRPLRRKTRIGPVNPRPARCPFLARGRATFPWLLHDRRKELNRQARVLIGRALNSLELAHASRTQARAHTVQTAPPRARPPRSSAPCDRTGRPCAARAATIPATTRVADESTANFSVSAIVLRRAIVLVRRALLSGHDPRDDTRGRRVHGEFSCAQRLRRAIVRSAMRC